MESGNFETHESAELTPEEQVVVDKALELFKLQAELGNEVDPNTNLEDGKNPAELFNEKIMKLNDEYLELYNNLSEESKAKVYEKEIKEAERLGYKPKAA